MWNEFITGNIKLSSYTENIYLLTYKSEHYLLPRLVIKSVWLDIKSNQDSKRWRKLNS